MVKEPAEAIWIKNPLSLTYANGSTGVR